MPEVNPWMTLQSCFDWSFRRQARLDKKNDERLTAYYIDFMAMCRRVGGQATEEDAGKGEWKKKKKRLKHAQNFVNTVDQKGKPLLCNFILIEQIYREKKESLLQGGMY